MKIFAVGIMFWAIFSGSLVFAKCNAGETRTNKLGIVMTCDTSNSGLGEAYKTPSGVIWGEVIRENVSLTQLTIDEAEQKCAAIGAKVPSEDDWQKMRIELVDDTFLANDGKTPMLPDIFVGWYWTSTAVVGREYGPDQNTVVAVNGPYGRIPFIGLFLTRDSYIYARCIVK